VGRLMAEPSRADRAVSFANTAELYEYGRPTYPLDLLAELFEAFGVERPRILDLAAGTGKLTRSLVPYGPVIAVEPLDEMRAQLERAVPEATALRGAAEAIPLEDSSVDVVFAAQAFHWFDQTRANPEIARVLVEGGHLVAMWNEEKPVEWITRLNRLMSHGQVHEVQSVRRAWWKSSFQREPWFTEPVVRTGSMVLSTTKQQVLANMESHSFLSVRAPADRQPVLDEIRELMADFPDPFDIAYNTEAYWCRKLPQPPS
jgi:SAM-dependent methyltransferase